MKKENIYIDLSKCSTDEQEHIFSLLPPAESYGDYTVTYNCRYLIPFNYAGRERWITTLDNKGKTELTYPEFIKLFEGEVENNGWIKIEKSEDLPRRRDEYWFVSQLEKDKIVKAYFNPYSTLDGNKAHYVKLYSHYQPIVKPEPPKF